MHTKSENLKRSLGRPRHGSEGSIKIHFVEMECVDWIRLCLGYNCGLL